MSVVKWLPAPDQDVVVLAEDDYVVVLLFYGDAGAVDFEQADAVVLLDASEAERLSTALVEAVARTKAAA
jgi:hypothetical protein